MSEPLENDITKGGLGQASLVSYLRNVRDLVNELRTDYTALLADVTAIRAATVGITAQLDGDAGVTETTYASGNDPAAITGTAIAEAALVLTKG